MAKKLIVTIVALIGIIAMVLPGCAGGGELPSAYIGSGALDGNGIPVDFFSDIDVRKGFCYAFDYDTYISDALQGQGEQRGSPVVEGLPFFNPDASMYSYNLTKAEEHLRAAWGGQVWEKGFKFTILYNAGNVPRKTACEILAESLLSINDKFNVSIQPVAWPTFLGKIWGTRDMPMFQIGWLPDYPHPDNFIVPFMHSTAGAFSAFQGYGSPELDAKISAAFQDTNPVTQQEKYYELQEIYYQDPGGIMLAQPIARRYFTEHISGFYYNPVEPSYPGRVYNLTKVQKPGSPIEFKNPDTFVEQTIGDVDSLDPAWIYDTASAQQVGYIYETLLYFDGEKTDEFVPVLATEWAFNSTDNTLRFKIREGVKFHEGGNLTAEDVEYTFERAMVQDRPGGPIWMFFQPLLDAYSSDDVTFADIAGAVEVDGDWVVFNLVGDYWELAFKQILCGGWAAIVDKEWCIAQGDWDGTETTWLNYNHPEDPGDTVLFNKSNGTGPWKLNLWEPGRQIKVEKNTNYWGGSVPFNWVITKFVEEWTSRKLALLAGDADLVYVPATNFDEMDEVTGLNVYRDLPSLSVDAFFFNMIIGGPSS